MNSAIKPKHRRYIAQRLEDGRSDSVDDFVDLAITSFRTAEADLAKLRKAIQDADAEIDRGDGVEWNLLDAKERLMRNLRAQRRKRR